MRDPGNEGVWPWLTFTATSFKCFTGATYPEGNISRLRTKDFIRLYDLICDSVDLQRWHRSDESPNLRLSLVEESFSKIGYIKFIHSHFTHALERGINAYKFTQTFVAYALHRGIFTTSEAWKAFYNWRFEEIAYQNTFIAICDSAFTNMQQTVTDFLFILLNNFVTCVSRSLAHHLKLVSYFTVICYALDMFEGH